LKTKVCLIFIFVILFSYSVFAAEKAVVVINGIETNITAVINEKGNGGFIPFAAFFKKIGCTVTYDAKTKTSKAVSDSLEAEITLGSKTAKINSLVVNLDEAPYIDNGAALAPVQFIKSALNIGYGLNIMEHYTTDDANNTSEVNIYTSAPAGFDGKKGKLSAKVYYFYEEDTAYSLNYAGYVVCIPYFSGFDADKINKIFEDDYNSITEKFVAELKRVKAANAADYHIVEERGFRVVSQNKNIISIIYSGLARYNDEAVVIQNGVNINLNDPYIMAIKDLFKKNSGYREVLTGIMKVKNLPAISNSFYLKDGSLFIFYDPYELSPDADDFTTFEVPLDSLKDILKDEFK